MPIRDFAAFGHPAVQEVVNQHDWVIVQRNLLIEDVWTACDYWRTMGKLVCADLDDDYPRLTPQNPAHHFWIGASAEEFEKQRGMKPIEALTEGLRHVDALLSPNRLILQDWAEVVPGYLLKNYAQGEWYEDIEQKPIPKEGEPIVIGWGGSVSHYDSWWFSGLKDAMLVLFEKYPRLHAKICGNDHRLVQMFQREWPEGRWHHQPSVPPQEWPKQVASFDIGVAPLAGPGAPQSELYDQHRSDIKAVEYILCGVPWVASPGIVYEDLDGRGGLRVKTNTKEAWVEALSDVIEHLEERKAQSQELMAWGRRNLTIEHHIEDAYVKLYRRIKAETDARHGLRLPNIIYVADLIKADRRRKEKKGGQAKVAQAQAVRRAKAKEAAQPAAAG